LQKYQAAR